MGAFVLASPISKLYNLLIKHYKFPLVFKHEIETTIQTSVKKIPLNCYSVSLLMFVSKVMEKVFHDQTKNFPNE